jgi:GST-like protein
MIKFYFHHTPNPLKVALMLEEVGLPYEVVGVDTFKGEQHSQRYRAVNPNAKVPAIDDHGVVVFDSNAILLYLGEKTGKFLGSAAARPSLLSWLMFVASGLGPFSGQAVHFRRVHTGSGYATNRYLREVERHYDVLERRLSSSKFIAGSDYTIVDIAAWGWVSRAGYIFDDDAALSRWPTLERWLAAIDARPAAVRAGKVGSGIQFKTVVDEETLRALFPQNFPVQAE